MAVTTLADLAKRFAAMPAKVEACVALELKRVGMHVRDTATRKFGEYQPAIGPYPGWAPLASSTIREKAIAGGAEDPLIGHYPSERQRFAYGMGLAEKDLAPSLRRSMSGTVEHGVPLRTSIEMDVVGPFEVNVGTADPIGKYHEYGTEHTPPRPFLRPAAFENEEYLGERMGAAVDESIRRM